MQELTWIGPVIDRFARESQGEKGAFTRLTLKSSEYVGGEKKYENDFVQVMATGPMAERLAKVPDGTVLWAKGRARVGKPYEVKNGPNAGELRAPLEMFIRDWGYANPPQREGDAPAGDEGETETRPARTTAPANRPQTMRSRAPQAEAYDDPFVS